MASALAWGSERVKKVNKSKQDLCFSLSLRRRVTPAFAKKEPSGECTPNCC